MIKIYIAATFEKKDYMLKLFKMIKDHFAVELSCDWSTHNGRSYLEMLRYIEADKKGIREADLIIFINDGQRTIGKHFELGYAVAFNKPVIMLCIDDWAVSPFYNEMSISKVYSEHELIIKLGSLLRNFR